MDEENSSIYHAMVSLMKLKKRLPLLCIVILSFAFIAMDLHHYLSMDALKKNHAALQYYVEMHPVVSVIAFMGSYIAVVALSIPGATFMTLAGGLFFGQWLGALMVVLSATAGACILFMSARMATSGLLAQRSNGMLIRMQSGFQQNAFSYLLTLRLIPVFPFVLVNFAAAVFQVPLKTFFLATLLGIIPGSMVYVSMGVAIQKVINTPNFTPSLVLEPTILVALIGLGVLSLLPIVYQRVKREK